MYGDITNELVVMDTAIALNDFEVAKFLQRLCPAPDAANGSVAISGEPRLGDVEAGASPAVGDEDQPEPVWTGFEGWTVGVFPAKDMVGKLGVGLNRWGSSRHGRNGGSFGFDSHGEAFPPAARRKFGTQL